MGDFDDQWLAERGRAVTDVSPPAPLLARLKFVASLVAADAAPHAPASVRSDFRAAVVHRLLWRGESRGVRSLKIEGDLVVGRSPSCGLVLADSRVSRRHCAFSISGTTLYLRDLGSANGTWRNGRRIEGVVGLRDGDVLEVGGQMVAYVRSQHRSAIRKAP